ncbi:MAG: helix-hairpin-helix domain-containing protein [Acidimicrobiia bacterium]
MPDTFSPEAQARPGHADEPDPAFWGPARPGRGRNGGLVRPVAPAGAFDRALDRLRAWRADPRAGVAVLVVVAVAAGFAWYRIGLGSGGGAEEAATDVPTEIPSEVPAVPSSDGPAPSGPAGAPSAPEDGDVTVHVAGAVARPGVVELRGRSRVIDAVEAAGGGLPDADLDRMNLAARLVDGQRVLVQRVGEPPAPAEPSAGPATPSGDAAPTSAPISLNTATQEQLETLPGIGPVLAEAIITERDRRGGFRSVNELRDVRGIGDKRFADLESLVTV